MIVGYARVSTDGQGLDAQHSALAAAGAEKTFSEKVSGVARDVTRAKKEAVLDDIAGTCLDKAMRLTRSASFPKASSASSRLQPGLARK